MSEERIVELRSRIKRAGETIAAFERIEAELRAISALDDPVRLRELMKAHAEILNATRMRLGSYRGEMAKLIGEQL